jgi:type VI secretion system secreted protein Hcp
MGFDAFMKIATIPGESTDDKHKDWIELLSFSHGVSQPAAGSVSGTGGLGGGRTDHKDFTIVHHLDKASPKLHLACCKGEHVPDVTIELCKAGGDKNKYMIYKMSDVMVRSVEPTGDAKGVHDLPLEQASFSYAKMEWTYTAYDNKGKPKGDVKANWDLALNKGG